MAVSKHTLDEESEYFLDLINATAGTKPPSELSVEEARYHDDATSRLFGGEIVFDGDINDIKTEHNIAGKSVCIIVRVYKPTICQDDPPILIYFHGGGFVMGQLHSVETTCKKIACLSKCIVISVYYRLAPEYKYPTCFYDGICTTKWVIGNKTTIGGNEQSIVGVCGSSAGGTIAAVVAIEVPSVSFQILFYPPTRMNGEFQSQREFEKGYYLEMDTIRWLSNYFYNSTDEWDDSFGHPLLRDKSALSASPNALFIIAECDPLRDEGLAYADKLKDAGGHVEIYVMEGVIHSFFTLPRHFRSNWSKAYSKVDAFIAKCKLEQ